MKSWFTKAGVHRLLVLVLCNAATAAQSYLSGGTIRWQALVTGTVAAAFSALLGWFIGNLQTPDQPPTAP